MELGSDIDRNMTPVCRSVCGEENHDCDFQLGQFRIANTRSLHKDTVYVSIAITVGANPAVIQTRAMGDLNNGTYQTGLSVEADIPNDNTPVAVNYVIVNNGHSGKDTVERALQTAVSALGDEAVKVAS